ncbi:hypothetical protein NLG97_g5960 [Lecanicillium saksenae]|uniref:Uncharacterized protein n=1 Tax=Lecanicillium saksenae TaxID=468837 RepID=A0ACC1QUU2_9HYPO|nr:hypothetical protein NLG97_g5960 [Lecanicillium saksenae]
MFSDLPLELRLKIWFFTIPDDDEKVCLSWPCGVSTASQDDGQVRPLEDLPMLPVIVDVAFLHSMHVCRESRAEAQDKKQNGVRCRASHVARMTPFRHVRPELDVLYLSHDSIHHLMLLDDRQYSFMGSLGLNAAQEACYVLMDIFPRTRRLTIYV